MGQCLEDNRQKGKPVRRIPLRIDVLDASSLVKSPADAPVFVTVRLAAWFKRLGDAQGLEKLRKAVNLGVLATQMAPDSQKSNFFLDPVPAEYLTVERFYRYEKPGLLIDAHPLPNAEMLYDNW